MIEILKVLLFIPFVSALIVMCWFACYYSKEEILDIITDAEEINIENTNIEEK